MGKYSGRIVQEPLRDRNRQAHPIWRGVGFALLILTPIIAIFGSIALVEANATQGWVEIPRDLIAKGVGDPLLYVKIIVGLVIFVFVTVFFRLITFILYGAFGPSRYGPLDVPPVDYKGPKKSR
jgi:hypothetical protein